MADASVDPQPVVQTDKANETLHSTADGSEKPEKRQRWNSRVSFVLAGMGAAIGLGNVWRFPYLCYKHGGGAFLIPYVLALLFFGIPLTIMELAFGQKFQRGDIGVFRAMHPRLSGIGLMSCFGGLVITWYYVPIIAYAFYYFLHSFASPLPWDPTNVNRTQCSSVLGPAGSFFYQDVLGFVKDDCSFPAVGDHPGVAWPLFGCTVFLWLCTFLCTAQGIRVTQYIVWFTVLAPWAMVIMFVIQGTTLDGASDGIDMYMKGITPPGLTAPDEPAARKWTDAVHQIFFTIGICMGLMTSYGSYNKKSKPVIQDTLAICVFNSLFSFVAGFAVFGIVGYLLQSPQSAMATKAGGFGLVFQAYPVALALLPGSNFFCVMFFLMLVLLGFDSAFAMVEACCTIIYDTNLGRRVPRWSISAGICMTGVLFSFLFCAKEGVVYLDAVDHYNGTYILLFLGIMQCMACGWVYGFTDRADKCGKTSTLVFDLGFWVPLIVAAPLAFFGAADGSEWVGLLVLFLPWALCVVASFCLCEADKKQAWKQHIWFAGIDDLSSMILELNNAQKEQRFWFPVFRLWWNFSIKYFIPAALWFFIWWSMETDVANLYSGYPKGIQWMGGVTVLIAVAIVVSCFFLITTAEGPNAMDQQESDDESTNTAKDKVEKPIDSVSGSGASEQND